MARTRAKKDGNALAVHAKDANITWFALFICVLVLLVWSSLIVVDNAQQMRTLYQSLGTVQGEHDELMSIRSRLRLERGAVSSLHNIEKLAQEELGMHFPQASEVLE
ncbi:MAG: cell division protein FtsL [Pseudomonadota bacterium]